MELGIELAESGWLPDWILRQAIRGLIRQRLHQAGEDYASGAQGAFIKTLAASAVAPASNASREQHYEAPTAFFQLVLGPRLKYSCCLYNDKQTSLEAAEEAMLALTCERAQLEDGMSILELGCGWGALTLWMAERYPAAHITAVSNSSTQRTFIEGQCRRNNIKNVSVITADMNTFDTRARFQRVVSVEMFEHMRNYPELLRRISRWLAPDGNLFVHLFCHNLFTYPFVAEGQGNWMARNFFTGGLMPAYSLLPTFNDHLVADAFWKVNGTHYYRTCMDWLAKLDRYDAEAVHLFEKLFKDVSPRRLVQRWRMFFMACAELFRHNDGQEWFVGHYRFKQKQAAPVHGGENALQLPHGIATPWRRQEP